jgi:trigger factor
VKVVEGHFGPEQIRSETISNEFLSELLQEAFKTKDLNVVHIPNIERVEFDNPEATVTIEAKVELFPDVTLADYKKLKLTVEVPRVDIDAQCKSTLDRLMLQQSTYQESDSAVEMGDEIVLDFDGQYKKDDGSFEPKPGMKAEGYQTIVEPGRFIDNFLEQTVGMKAGESKDILVKFPEAYHDMDLAGKDAKFAVKIQKVSKPQKPELNDDFAKSFNIDTIDELQKRIREEITNVSEQTRKGIVSEAIITELHAHSKVKLSEAMVERELENDLATLQYRNHWNDKQIQEYIQNMDRPTELAQARKKLEKSIIITSIIRDEKLEVTEEEVRAELGKLNLPPDFDMAKLDMGALINRINLDLLTQKAIDLLISHADIEYKEVEGHTHVHGPDCGHSH